jgi:solute carrier family 25 (mitochondrial S-adenosylmethionine transporter), member 26
MMMSLLSACQALSLHAASGIVVVMFMNSLIAGGVAGAVTDISLHPIDTLKTRLQTGNLVRSTVMFQGCYNGIGAAVLASAPTAAIFFCTYDTLKELNILPQSGLGYGLAAGAANGCAALFRVPFEVIKQQSQASLNKNVSCIETLRHLLRTQGSRSLYNGLGATLTRDIPFSFIQFPIYEALKLYNGGSTCSPELAAVCGSVAGGTAAAITCPLDVVKTRRMLGSPSSSLISILKSEGIQPLFGGILPRISFTCIGGLVWFGTYEKTKTLLNK